MEKKNYKQSSLNNQRNSENIIIYKQKTNPKIKRLKSENPMKSHQMLDSTYQLGSDRQMIIRNYSMGSGIIPQMITTNPLIPYGMIPVNDPLSILQIAPQVKIKQTIEWLEVITGYETKNRYIIYAKINSQNFYLFKCKEESGFCMRNCCPW